MRSPRPVVPEPEPCAQPDVQAEEIARAMSRLPEIVRVEAGPPATGVEALAAREAPQPEPDAEIERVRRAGPELRGQPRRRAGDQPHADGALDSHLRGVRPAETWTCDQGQGGCHPQANGVQQASPSHPCRPPPRAAGVRELASIRVY